MEVEKQKIEEKNAKNAEQKVEAKKAQKKPTRSTVVARGNDLGISTKHSIAICKFLKNKKIEPSIKFLQEVIEFKKAMPMKGELPHRRNLGEGRYPIKASAVFIKLLQNLKANAASANMDIGKIFLHAKADKASRPRKPGKYHRKFKRTHVEITGAMRE